MASKALFVLVLILLDLAKVALIHMAFPWLMPWIYAVVPVWILVVLGVLGYIILFFVGRFVWQKMKKFFG